MKRILLFCVALVCLGVQVAGASEDALFEEGVSLLKQEKAGEAVERFSRVIELIPDHPDAYRNRGVAFMKLDEYDKAIQDFERALELKPDLKDLYSNLGVAWYYKKDYQRAIEYYNKELSLRPLNHFGYFNRAICWAALNRFEEGLADVNKSLDLYPDHYLALCLKGDLLRETGQPDRAASAYRRAIALDPVQPYARKQLSVLDAGTPAAGEDGGDRPESQIPESESASAGKEVLPAKDTSPVKEASTADTGGAAFEIQAGAFLMRENAENMVEKMEEKGYAARILELTGAKGRQWFLVRTGRFEHREDADDTLGRIKAEMGLEAVTRPADRF